jgi:hypothetical protein
LDDLGEDKMNRVPEEEFSRGLNGLNGHSGSSNGHHHDEYLEEEEVELTEDLQTGTHKEDNKVINGFSFVTDDLDKY